MIGSILDARLNKVFLYPILYLKSLKAIPAYTHSSAASIRAFHKCKAKELRTMTR
jgi:hypothetical protein